VAGIATDVRSLDPAAYAQAVGLQPEDCYGFLPIDHDDVTPYLYLYRDRPEYEQAREGLAAPQRVRKYGPVRVEPTQAMEIDVSGAEQGDLSEVLDEAQRMAEAHGAAGFGSSTAAQPGAAGPDPARLARLERLRSSGAITEQEYMRLAAEWQGPAPTGESSNASGDAGAGGGIVAHRLYPRLHRRSSTRQLDHFLPRYRETLGLRSDDVYGVLPRRTRWSVSSDSHDTKEWDDFWIVYRDRPEYEQGREMWAREMDKGGGWPEVSVASGVGEPPRLTHDQGGGLEVEKERWPRHKLVMRETGTDLGESLREKIEGWGYGPEDSLGFCPNYPNRRIYFAWRRQ